MQEKNCSPWQLAAGTAHFASLAAVLGGCERQDRRWQARGGSETGMCSSGASSAVRSLSTAWRRSSPSLPARTRTPELKGHMQISNHHLAGHHPCCAGVAGSVWWHFFGWTFLLSTLRGVQRASGLSGAEGICRLSG